MLGTGIASALGVKPGDSVTLMATTPDATLNAVDAVLKGLADVQIRSSTTATWRSAWTSAPACCSPRARSEARRVLKPGAGEGATAVRLGPPSPPPDTLSRCATGRSSPSSTSRCAFYIGIFGFVGAVLVVIVILSAAIVTIAVTERTREIGTLRALGTRPSGILKLFLAEGVALAVGGCLVGAVVALVIRAALNASGSSCRRLRAPPTGCRSTCSSIHWPMWPVSA